MSPTPTHPTRYEIRVAGHLPSHWADWFEGLVLSLEEGGDTVLTGPVVDQAALHGLLKKVRDLGLSLVSVSMVEPSALLEAEPGDPSALSPIAGDTDHEESAH